TAIRAASIWRLVIHAGSIDLMPNEPKANSDPRVALPFIRPFCIFLNFVLFGCNMFVSYFMLLMQLYSFLMLTYPLFPPPRLPPRRSPPRRSPSRRSPPRRGSAALSTPRVFTFEV